VAHHAVARFEDQRDVNLKHGVMKKWIDFANGKEPWDDVTAGEALYITSDAQLVVVPVEEVKSGRWQEWAEMKKNWTKVKIIRLMM